MNKRILFTMLALSSLTACNGTSTGTAVSSKSLSSSQTVTNSTSTSTQSTGGSSSIDVTYYTLSRTEAPISGWSTKTYTATGSCAIINSLTYCWSDGLKTLQWTSGVTYGPYYYNYWEVQTSSGGSIQSCHGGCTDDYMATPMVMTTTILVTIPQANVQQVFNTGTVAHLTCSQVTGGLSCGSLFFPQ